MIIDQQTKITFKPKSKKEDDGIHVALYDVTVDGKETGVTEVVVSQGRKVTRTLETTDGNRYQQDQLAEALIHEGHKVET